MYRKLSKKNYAFYNCTTAKKAYDLSPDPNKYQKCTENSEKKTNFNIIGMDQMLDKLNSKF